METESQERKGKGRKMEKEVGRKVNGLGGKERKWKGRGRYGNEGEERGGEEGKCKVCILLSKLVDLILYNIIHV